MKIEKLKKSLHLIDSSCKKNKHTVFVDTDKEAKEFDAAKFFNTHPAFLDRPFNRPTLESLMEAKDAAYRELERRIDRARELKIVSEKLDAKLHSMDNSRKKKLVQKETKESAAVYKFTPKRQR